MKLHKRTVLISGMLALIEIFNLFQTWQLSILTLSIRMTLVKWLTNSDIYTDVCASNGTRWHTIEESKSSSENFVLAVEIQGEGFNTTPQIVFLLRCCSGHRNI
jgi:hypothetical protein